MRILFLATTLWALLGATSVSADNACLGCHINEDGSPVHALMQSSHGKVGQACEACHGPSGEHMARPTMVSPDITFGPRWTSTTALQDSQCLACHKANVASHWNESLHMANNVTCVSCHSLHVEEDPISARGGQLEVCTTCHKTQKTGIHGKQRMVRMNPDCTSCHNPHADQSPTGVMLANNSEGCRRCHNLEVMASSANVSSKAKSYHLVMNQGEMTCNGCHVGVAHGDTASVEPFIPLPQSEREVTLFAPGQSDADWLLSEHPGSQPLRQGTNCRQCHRGEEAELGAALGGPAPTSRPVSVNFSVDGDSLVTLLSWDGSEEDTQISLMWGFGDYAPLRRGGCWAACHGDNEGMTLDRGRSVPKYLWAARAQQRQVGQQVITKDREALAAELAAGNFAELWRIDLRRNGKLKVATLLEKPDTLRTSEFASSASFENGRWTARVTRPMSPEAPLRTVSKTQRYTFGIALHGKERKGSEHWVSLPMTLSLDRDDTDFITR